MGDLTPDQKQYIQNNLNLNERRIARNLGIDRAEVQAFLKQHLKQHLMQQEHPHHSRPIIGGVILAAALALGGYVATRSDPPKPQQKIEAVVRHYIKEPYSDVLPNYEREKVFSEIEKTHDAKRSRISLDNVITSAWAELYTPSTAPNTDDMKEMIRYVDPFFRYIGHTEIKRPPFYAIVPTSSAEIVADHPTELHVYLVKKMMQDRMIYFSIDGKPVGTVSSGPLAW
jgi:predicted DNA-binding transcriptional regulator